LKNPNFNYDSLYTTVSVPSKNETTSYGVKYTGDQTEAELSHGDALLDEFYRIKEGEDQ